MSLFCLGREDQPTEGQGDGAIDIVLSPEKKSTSITADVYMSGGEILRDYQQWEWVNHNPEVVQTGRNGQITGVGSGEAYLGIWNRVWHKAGTDFLFLG